MEQLPADVMARVLEYSRLPERLNLARCSTSLLKLITKECCDLWTYIDFHFCNVKRHARLAGKLFTATSVTKAVVSIVLISAVSVRNSFAATASAGKGPLCTLVKHHFTLTALT